MTYYLPRSSLLLPAVARVNSRIGRRGVGRGDGRLRCWVGAPPRKIRAQFHEIQAYIAYYFDGASLEVRLTLTENEIRNGLRNALETMVL